MIQEIGVLFRVGARRQADQVNPYCQIPERGEQPAQEVTEHEAPEEPDECTCGPHGIADKILCQQCKMLLRVCIARQGSKVFASGCLLSSAIVTMLLRGPILSDHRNSTPAAGQIAIVLTADSWVQASPTTPRHSETFRFKLAHRSA